MDNLQQQKAGRRRVAQERLGSQNFRCVVCGESNPHCLELHHIAGRQFGDDKVPVCRNCHRKLSDDQKDHPRPIADDPHWLENIGHYLLGLADWLALAVESLRQFSGRLIEEARAQIAGHRPS